MKLYDLNKAGYNSLPALSSEEEKKAINLIHKYLKRKSDSYYMMLNHDTHYFTLFKRVVPSVHIFATEVFNVAKTLGVIKSVELSQDEQMIEIWITNVMTNECYMYGFFAYDNGVIEV